ncbi:MAG: hypothetical protein OES79_16715 [Planctomycetota bacterium]|nr:hypothetical protein [Planctomycetota bacterium]
MDRKPSNTHAGAPGGGEFGYHLAKALRQLPIRSRHLALAESRQHPAEMAAVTT